MNDKKYEWLLYLIIITIGLTIAVQGYWNYKNYLLNKQNFINQVQISLDNALDTYYADLAESNQMTFIDMESDTLFIDMESDTLFFNEKLKHLNPDSILEKFQIEYKNLPDKEVYGVTQITSNNEGFTFSKTDKKLTHVKVIHGKKATDSINLLKGITAIYISIHNDTLDFFKLNPLIDTEFNRKKFNIPHALRLYKNESVINSYNTENIKSGFLKTTAKSSFLKNDETLELVYPNATRIILMQGLSGILLSLLLSLAIISSLFYLLKIIKHQKQLAEVKNDLISNITHEFKTPIATISVALESIKKFNVIDDKEKTKTYLEMSNNQLTKLNIMVEKLLETATLDSNSLDLNKEPVNISDLLSTIIDKHQMQNEAKTISFNASKEGIIANVDVFHFENAINNIIDNAIKYGGNKISVILNQKNSRFEISISDNGNTLTKANKDKIFEKFYRVPKGNTHDVKGFGIGLYYAKKIIEKHNGSIHLDLNNNLTTFKISLPNE